MIVFLVFTALSESKANDSVMSVHFLPFRHRAFQIAILTARSYDCRASAHRYGKDWPPLSLVLVLVCYVTVGDKRSFSRNPRV